MNLENYEPERLILSEHQKARNRSKIAESGLGTTLPREPGCGDFRALVVDPITGNCRRAEVEVIIRSRAKELASKPARITDYYAGSPHRCFLIELWQHKLARLVSNVLAPLTEVEIADSAAPSAARKTVSETRLSKVRAALERRVRDSDRAGQRR